jgi:site-specific DNA-methyltransferase (adenine-specific)
MSSGEGSIQDVLEGRARWALVHGECEDVLPTMPDRSVAHVIADPPYSAHVHGLQRRMLRGAGKGQTNQTRRGADGRSRGEVGPAALGFDALSPELRRACGEQFARLAQRWILAFADEESRHLWQADLEAGGARHIRCGVWRKVAGQPQLSGDRPAVGHEAIEIAHAAKGRLRWNGGGLPAFWAHQIATDRNGTGDRVHTTQKPLDLMLCLVVQFTEFEEVVLDPFAGSGTTGVACLRLGRRFIGVEKDATYAAVARERLAAESQGLTLRDARAGQQSLFGGAA